MTSVFESHFAETLIASQPAVGSKVFVVHTEAQFKTALSKLSAIDGGTIKLAADCPPFQITIRDIGTDKGTIHITSENPADPVHVHGFRILDAKNIKVSEVYVDSMGCERASYLKDLQVERSSNITFENSEFHSFAEKALMTDTDVRAETFAFIKNVQGFVFEDNYVAGYLHGLKMTNVNDVLIEGNEITKMQGDGIHGSGWQNVKIADNYIHDMFGSSQAISHSDMIQLWGGLGAQPSVDVLISGNRLDSGDGPAYQSVFIRQSGDGEIHKNIHVIDNLIFNGQQNAIRISGSENTVVADNTVLWNFGSSITKDELTSVSSAPRIVVNDKTALITGNISERIVADAGATIKDNMIVSYGSPSDPNYFAKHFVAVSEGGFHSLADLQLRPDSAWVGKYGATLSQPTNTAEELTAVMMMTDVPDERGVLFFDASLSRDEFGFLDGRAEFKWTFSDGKVAKGMYVERHIEKGDSLTAELTVVRKDGATASVDHEYTFLRADVADVNFDGGPSATNGFSYINADASNFVASAGGKAFHLDGSSGVRFDPKDQAWGSLDEFTMDIGIAKDTAAAAGRILQLQKVMKLYIANDGRAVFELVTDGGTFMVHSGAARISDKLWHSINVTYDGDAKSLSMSIDGKVAATTTAFGTTAPQGPYPMTIGATGSLTSIKARVDDFHFVARSEVIEAEVLDEALSSEEFGESAILVPVDDVGETQGDSATTEEAGETNTGEAEAAEGTGTEGGENAGSTETGVDPAPAEDAPADPGPEAGEGDDAESSNVFMSFIEFLKSLLGFQGTGKDAKKAYAEYLESQNAASPETATIDIASLPTVDPDPIAALDEEEAEAANSRELETV